MYVCMYVRMYVCMYVPTRMFRRILTINSIKNFVPCTGDVVRFLYDTTQIFNSIALKKNSDTAQAVSRRPLAAEAPDRLQASTCEDCGEQSGTETGFPPRISVVPCQYYSTNAPYWSASASCSYWTDGQTGKAWEPSQKAMLFRKSERAVLSVR